MDKILKNVNVHWRETDDSLYVVLSNKFFLEFLKLFFEEAKWSKFGRYNSKGSGKIQQVPVWYSIVVAQNSTVVTRKSTVPPVNSTVKFQNSTVKEGIFNSRTLKFNNKTP